MGITVNITGHRPYQKDKNGNWVSKLEFEGHSRHSEELFWRLVRLFEAYFKSHPEIDTVITGMALGVDLAAGVAAKRMKLKVHCYVPFKGHGAWKTFYGDIHRQLLERADYIHAPDVEFSKEQLLQRNKDMVDAADYTLALWDGTHGGTQHCVKYAKSQGKNVVNLWDNWIKYRTPIDT